MKKIYYLLILVLVTLVSCDNVEVKEYAEDIYLYNYLDKTIKIEVFNADGMLSCEVAPNDTAFFTTIDFTSEEDVIYEVYPGELAYTNFILGINRVTLYYGSEKYTYTEENKNDIIDLLYLERYWEIHFRRSAYEKIKNLLINMLVTSKMNKKLSLLGKNKFLIHMGV